MKREDLFPSKYLKCADLKGRPHLVQIKHAAIETLKSPQGIEQRKVVLYFNSGKKSLPLNLTNFDSVAEIAGTDETEQWAGMRIELYPTRTTMGGKIVDCIRIRKPKEPLAAVTKEEPVSAVDADLNDEVPWE
jgi:hypothetical protein